jgi:acetyl esterase/lipase
MCRLKLLLLFLIYCPICYLKAQLPLERPLYRTGEIPGAKPAENKETTILKPDGIYFTTETSIPTLTSFIPDNPNGIAVIICPGGGYWGTACDHEGVQVAKALNAAAISAFILKYRIPDDRTCVVPHLAPLQDVQRAIQTVRQNAEKLPVKIRKTGVLGFSAGGHLAATAATHWDFNANPSSPDTSSMRPDFALLIYPVISFSEAIGHAGSREKLLGKHPTPAQIDFFSLEKQMTKQTPPVFLVHAQNDNAVSVENSLAFYQACTRHGVTAAIHIYPEGGHGFGLNNPSTTDRWIDHAISWLKQWE